MPIVQRAEDEKFTSQFIVPVDSTAKTLADLKGKTFAFGSPSSTSGSLMPRFFLLKAGIDPDKDFKTVAFSGAHDATVAFVAAGRAEAGVLNASVLDKLVETENPNAAKVRVLATTPPYYDYNWTVRPGPRSGAHEEAHRRLPEARPGESRGTRRSSTCSAPPSSSRPRPSNYDGIEGGGQVGRADQVTGDGRCADVSAAAARRRAGARQRPPRAAAACRSTSARGERVAVIGPSGAGKTTLLRVLAASLRPSEGRIEIARRRPVARCRRGALRAPARAHRHRAPGAADSAAPARGHRRAGRPARPLVGVERARLAV